MKKLFVLALIIIAAGGGVYFYMSNQSEPAQKEVPLSEDVTWEFTDKGEDEETFTPMTQVTLHTSSGSHDLGTYAGSCSEIKDSSWSLVAGEKEGAICWWAGGGKEIGIFEENGNIVVKVGDLEEGTAGDPRYAR